MNLQEKITEIESLLFHAIKQTMRHMTTDASLSKQQIMLLRVVELHKTLTVTELANFLNLSTSATTIAVNRLVDCGLLKRRRDDADRRIVWIELSEKAQMVCKKLQAVRTKIFTEMLSKLEPEEVDQLLSILRKITANL